jgi:eukaryotic-like serine/threonine-protein kinase
VTDRMGQQLGNYRLMCPLGSDDFTKVYLGEHVHLNTQAVIKVLYTHVAGEDVEAFLAEIRVHANLEHPHIVRILDFDVQKGAAFLIMSYAPNGNLRQRYPKGSRLPLNTIVDYVKQVAAALHYAHDQKLIHRNIKPENMLLGRRNEVLLSDFSIALIGQSSSLQRTQEIIETAHYMSPEQFQGKPDCMSDQYALGVVVYEWLCGERPFHGTFAELYSQHMFIPPPSLQEKIPIIPSSIEQVVLRALSKDTQQRFASVQAFAIALEQACQQVSSRPVTLTSVTPPSMRGSAPSSGSQPIQPSQRPISRRKILVVLTGLAVAGTGITWLASSHPSFSSTSPVIPVRTAISTSIPLGIILRTYHGHSDIVFAVAWSPDGKRIASGSRDSTVQVWIAATGVNVLTYYGHANTVVSVGWSPDGTRIASSGFDNTVQVWDANNGGNVLTYRGHSSSISAVTWSPDGTRIASGSQDKTVRVWDTTSGTTLRIYRGHANIVNTVAWSPDGKYIASAGGNLQGYGTIDNTVQVWDATSGENVYTYNGHFGYVTTVAWSPNGTRIASGSYPDKTVQVWDATTGEHVLIYRNNHHGTYSVAWSPDGKYIASAGITTDNTIQVWNAATGKEVLMYIYPGQSDFANAIVWSPNGNYIASGSSKGVQVWQAI